MTLYRHFELPRAITSTPPFCDHTPASSSGARVLASSFLASDPWRKANTVRLTTTLTSPHTLCNCPAMYLFERQFNISRMGRPPPAAGLPPAQESLDFSFLRASVHNVVIISGPSGRIRAAIISGRTAISGPRGGIWNQNADRCFY